MTRDADDVVRLQDENDRLREELAQQSITLSAEHQRAERILDALREPSEAVSDAAFESFYGLDEPKSVAAIYDGVRSAIRRRLRGW